MWWCLINPSNLLLHLSKPQWSGRRFQISCPNFDSGWSWVIILKTFSKQISYMFHVSLSVIKYHRYVLQLPYVFIYCTMSIGRIHPTIPRKNMDNTKDVLRKIVVKLAHLRPSRFQRRSGTGAGPLFGKIARGKFSQVSWTEPAGTRVALYIVILYAYPYIGSPSNHQLVVSWKNNSHKSHPLEMHQNVVCKESCVIAKSWILPWPGVKPCMMWTGR